MGELSGLNLLCDETIIDKDKTTAQLCVGGFIDGGEIIRFDSAWEGDHCVYHNFFKDNEKYRMYYLAHSSKEPFTEIKVCYAESVDGRIWNKPSLGLKDFKGSKDNNIILDKSDKSEGDFFDNFFVFKDTNPICEEEKRYKALVYTHPYSLCCYFSKDGIRFTYGYKLSIEGKFDTLNICFYDEKLKKYVAYIRDFHNIPENGDLNLGVRDIRRTESDDFIKWTKPEILDFGVEKKDFPLYTNNVMKYPANDNFYIGFPTRYTERSEWTDNFDKLTGRDLRLERMKNHKRFGLAITDCLFMLSRDGKKWQRFDEALITPGVENGKNWVYGDCYPAYGIIENEYTYSMFLRRNQWTDDPAIINEIKIRKDGFAYYSAPFNEKEIKLKPAVLGGSKIYINFSTSAAGSIFMEISADNGEKITSCEMFGDSVKREVSIEKEKVEKLKGKIVTITIKAVDAKIYSLTVEK